MRLIVAISIIVVSILGYNLWPYFDCFYISIALCFFLCALALVFESEKGTAEHRLYYIFLFLSINNLLDEIFFDPKTFGMNEYFIEVLIIAHQLYLHRHAKPHT